jgi:hypothetical protein
VNILRLLIIIIAIVVTLWLGSFVSVMTSTFLFGDYGELFGPALWVVLPSTLLLINWRVLRLRYRVLLVAFTAGCLCSACFIYLLGGFGGMFGS